MTGKCGGFLWVCGGMGNPKGEEVRGGGMTFVLAFRVRGGRGNPKGKEVCGGGMTFTHNASDTTPCQLDFVAMRLFRGLLRKPLQISLMALNAIYRKT